MKTFGILSLSLIPVVLSYGARWRIIKEGKCKEAWIRFLEHLYFQIHHFSKGQEEIFLTLEQEDLEKCGFLLFLREEVRKDPVGALERALPPLEEAAGFGENEKEILHQFAKNFGMQSKSAQLEDIERSISFFKKREEEDREKRKNNAAVIRAVGLSLGIGLFILLI